MGPLGTKAHPIPIPQAHSSLQVAQHRRWAWLMFAQFVASSKIVFYTRFDMTKLFY